MVTGFRPIDERVVVGKLMNDHVVLQRLTLVHKPVTCLVGIHCKYLEDV